MKEKFFAFLKKHRVYKKWLKYTYDSSDEWLDDKNRAEKFIIQSFYWVKTNEGFDFWSYLNDSWLKELKKDPS